MVHSAVRRGRPKGTGIDDSARLERIAELLRLHPDFKPTTAIRSMGFCDPSAIRRLRDKYKLFAGARPMTDHSKDGLRVPVAQAGMGAATAQRY
jgi:hypothetical protein